MNQAVWERQRFSVKANYTVIANEQDVLGGVNGCK